MPLKTQVEVSESVNQKRRFLRGYKLFSVILLLIIIGLVLYIVIGWKPWQPTVKASDRVITVTGEATVTATPDEYVFTPTYDFTDAVQATALSQLTTTSQQIVNGLKALGTPSKDIQTSSDGYSSGGYELPVIPTPISQDNGQYTYELDLTVTIDDNTVLAQKVQNYLVTTNPTGDVTPSVNFSTAMQNSLENKARSLAEQNARANAVQSAKNLGFKIAAVKTVVDNGLSDNNVNLCDGSGEGVCAGSDLAEPTTSTDQNLTLQPGQNQLDYSVSVQFYIK
jgi:uncharacterized protein YggE